MGNLHLLRSEVIYLQQELVIRQEMFRRTAIILGLLSLTVPAVIAAEPNLDARAQCNANNCYRALQHTTGHFSTRGGALDCSAYLVTTVTPAASTVYSTRSVTDGRVTFVTFITPVTVEEVRPPSSRFPPVSSADRDLSHADRHGHSDIHTD